MIELHRDAVEFLRDYGATDISVDQNGSKHPRLVFEFRGKRVSHPVSSSPSDMNAARVLIRSLKRRLGDPDASVESKTKKALNDMTPSVPTPPGPPAVNSPAAGMRINTDGIYPAKRSVGRVAKYSQPPSIHRTLRHLRNVCSYGRMFPPHRIIRVDHLS